MKTLMQQAGNELQIEYRAYFESKLALMILENIGLIESAIDEISRKLLLFFKQHRQTILQCIAGKPAIVKKLYGDDYFGHLNTRQDNPSDIFADMSAVLTERSKAFHSIMLVHNIFIHEIFDYLCEQAKENFANYGSIKTEWVARLFPMHLFDTNKRVRQHIQAPKSHSTQLGISRHCVFAKSIGHGQSHFSAIDKFHYHGASYFEKRAHQAQAPFVAGPSGHTGSLLLGAKLYGDLSTEGLKQYTAACFVFLCLGGNHTFDEVMMVAANVGVDYQPFQYLPSLPESFVVHPLFMALQNAFPEFLGSEKSAHSDMLQPSVMP